MADLELGNVFNVKGLVAVVTGGGTGMWRSFIVRAVRNIDIECATGIGLMLAQALEANGAIVYIIGRRQEVLEKAAATAVCHTLGFRHQFAVCLDPYSNSFN
jgi:NAD(P)-dependent dehydrogenase (short-subunit alcohol dehydrogenase family)